MWACELQYPVFPERWKIRKAGKRIEVKLRKMSVQKWTDVGQTLQLDQQVESQEDSDSDGSTVDAEVGMRDKVTAKKEKSDSDVSC